MQKKINEKQFGDVFANSSIITQLCSSKSVYIAKEFNTSLGIPDYVLLTDDDYQKIEKFTNHYSGLRMSGKYAAIISYVAKSDKVCIDDLSEHLKKKRGEIISALKELEQFRVVDIDNKNEKSVKLRSGFEIPKIHSIAIELKLSSWKKALWQATRNSNQFTSSYVIMPKNKLVLLSDKIDYFKANKISTAVIDVESLVLTPIHDEVDRETIANSYYLDGINSIMHNLNTFKKVRPTPIFS